MSDHRRPEEKDAVINRTKPTGLKLVSPATVIYVSKYDGVDGRDTLAHGDHSGCHHKDDASEFPRWLF